MATPDSGYAQVFNNDGNGLDYLVNAANQRRQYEQQRKEKQRLKQQAYTQYVGDVFDNKNFATGTVYDPIIQKNIDASKAKFLGMLQKNPNADLADVAFQMQQDATRIGSISSKVKTLRAKVDQQFVDMDPKRWNKSQAVNLAMHDALYKDDGTGKKTLKEDPDEIDLDMDYRSHVQDNYFDVVSNLDKGDLMNEYLSRYKYDDVSGGFDRRDKKGNVLKNEYKGKAYTGIHDVFDDGTNNPYLKVKTRPIVVGKDEKTGKDKTIDVLDDKIYGDFVSNKERSSWLNNELKKAGVDIDPNTPEAELIKRQIVKDELQGRTQDLNVHMKDYERMAPNWVIYGTPPSKESDGDVDWNSTFGNLKREGNKIDLSQPMSNFKLGKDAIGGDKFAKNASYNTETGKINVDGTDYSLPEFEAQTKTLNTGKVWNQFFKALKTQTTSAAPAPKEEEKKKGFQWIGPGNKKTVKERMDEQNKSTKRALD
jgi:hypothetical protein